jgi:acyl-[acyl-carrier-protein] desaturase
MNLEEVILEEEKVLYEVMPEANRLVDRHLSQAKDWYPHVFVPWEKGRNFDEVNDWSPDEFPLPDVARSALLVNLLTEDNLPYYYRTISAHMMKFDGLREWSLRWTAEESRHSIVIRDYLTVTRAVDPWLLEDMRIAQLSSGIVPEPPTPIETLAYVTMQELATRISHRNTGKLIDDPVGFNIMARVSQDENLHHLFYRDILEACMEVNPSLTIRAISRQTRNFEMPGTGIPGFNEHAKAIAKANIYNFKLHHEQILKPLIERRWKAENISGLNEDGEKELGLLMRHMAKMEKVISRFS